MRRLLHILVSATIVVCLTGYAQAASAEQITVRIRSIAASTQGNSVDGELEDLESKLNKSFGDYTSFDLVDDESFEVDKGGSGSVTVPGGTEVTVKFKGLSEDLLRLGLTVGDKLRTSLRASPGSTFFQAGLSYKDGMLILAITAE
ncbi:MAG: hypothetical protein ACOCV2_03735 [Persicimonas sp.]